MNDVNPAATGRVRPGRGQAHLASALAWLENGPEEGMVASVLRALAILELFTAEHPVRGVADMARALGVSKSSASRLASTLDAAGYLERAAEPGRYRLGHRLRRLGSLAAGTGDIRHFAQQAMARVVDVCGETVHLGVREGHQAVTVDFKEGTHTVRMHAEVGKRGDAHCSAIGKVLLAAMPPAERDALYEGVELAPRTPRSVTSLDELKNQLRVIRELGYSYDDEESELGMRCVGAPIFGADGEVVAALTVAGPSSRINAGTVPLLSRVVRAAAADISARIGAAPEARYWGELPSPAEDGAA